MGGIGFIGRIPQLPVHKTRSVFDRYDVTSAADLEQAAARIEARRARQTEQPSATTTATGAVSAFEPVALVVQ